MGARKDTVSFTRTYVHNVLLGLDDLGAAIVFNRNDCSISAICRLAQLGQLDRVKASRWQAWILTHLAPILDWIQASHCELARQGEIERAKSTIAILS